MIIQLDKYVEDNLNKYLTAVLGSIGTQNENYVINYALWGLEDKVIENFKNSYKLTSGNTLPIDVGYSYPTQKEQMNARYVIMRNGTKEMSGGIGQDTGFFENRPANGENIQVESVTVNHDDTSDTYYVTTSQPISDVYGVEEATNGIIDRDNTEIGSTKIIIKNDEGSILVGNPITITYLAQDTGYRSTYGGNDKGFTAEDSVRVVSVSNNIDTLRCLDSIIKYIYILMKNSKENAYYQEANITTGPVTLVQEYSSLDMNVYQIETILDYNVTYAVPNDSSERIADVLIRKNYDKQVTYRG